MIYPRKNEIRKPSKTLAGVTPIAVMCKPKKCKHGTCLYCPSLNVPQSYTPKSPPVLRAERLKYNPNEQVKSRIKAFELMNHPTEKIELIIMGGNFLDYSEEYKLSFIKACFDALNNKKSKNLEQAKKINEKAKHRCVALCIETRPDTIVNNKDSINELLNFGCTRVELGVQCLDDKIYKFVNRGHTVKEVIEATKLLRNFGFKIGYHMMLGLPKSTISKDLKMFKKLFSDQNFKPDQIKIYPCQVIKGAALEKLYSQGKYKPYTKEETQKLIIKIMKIIPNYCRVMRIMREIPPDFLIAGTIRIDLRRDIDYQLKKNKTKINEIRFREVGFETRDRGQENINQNLKLKITKYNAAKGKEYFLEFINKNNILFGLCRLRIQNNTKSNTNRTNHIQAIVRELHVYGQSLSLGKKSDSNLATQHKGLGKLLLAKAEEITKKEKIQELYVISGVGVRQYYKKLGYFLKEAYMIKKLK